MKREKPFLKKLAFLLSLVLALSTIPFAVFAADGDTWEVTFLDGYNNDNEIIDVVTVTEGALSESTTASGIIDAPPDHDADGYHFVNWTFADNSEVTKDAKITSDATVTANYEINTYTVIFNFVNEDGVEDSVAITVDHNGSIDSTILDETLFNEKGINLPLPNYFDEDGVEWEFTEWSSAFPVNNVTSDMDITAVYEAVDEDGEETTFTVYFVDYDGSEILTVEDVASGTIASSIAPTEDPTREGYTFTGWNPVLSTEITADQTFTAQYTTDAAKDAVEDLINGDKTIDEVLGDSGLPVVDESSDTPEANDAESFLADGKVEEDLTALSEAYRTALDIEEDTNDVDLPSAFSGKPSIVGLALNGINKNDKVSMKFSTVNNEDFKPFDKAIYDANSMTYVDINLFVNAIGRQLRSPLIITMPIPNGMKNGFKILHFDDNGYGEITPVVNRNDNTCKFIVLHLSQFAFVNAAETPVDPDPETPVNPVTPSDNGNNNGFTSDDRYGSSNSSSSNSRGDRNRSSNYSSNSSSSVSTPVANWQIGFTSPDAAPQSAAQVNVNVTTDNFNIVRLNVSNAMIKDAVLRASLNISHLKAADPTADLFIDVIAQAETSLAAAAPSSTSVVIEGFAIDSLASAGLGLAVTTPTSYMKLDSNAVKELAASKKPSFNFTVKPVAFPNLQARTAANGHAIYDVTLKDLFGLNVAPFTVGSAEFGISYQASATETAANLRAARVINSDAVVIEGSTFNGTMVTWKNVSNTVITVTSQGE